MVRVCPHCGCSDIDEDAGRGDATCTGCGTVIEESIVVSENQFQERAGGSGHTLVGQTISMDRAHVAIQGVPGLASQESREVTYAKGRKLIEEVASQLRINKQSVDTAFNFFKMCVTRNLTRGRLRSHVVAACLYMTCRLDNTSHLLLDFSDVTQVNVYELGRCLNFLSRSLRINLPTTDPCLYVLRFAVLLDFGDKQKEVVTLATRLVQRMKRDWLATGRRPTGLCGAALLLAARSFNFNRSVTDVVRVVHVSEAVVRKRLDEFSQTPSSALTLDQFSSVDLEHSEDPPAYREARRKAIVAREEEEAEKMERDMAPMQKEVETALEKKQKEMFKKSPYARMVGSIEGGEEMGRAEKALIMDDVLDSVYREVGTPAVEDVYRETSWGPSLESLGIMKGGVAPPPSFSYSLPAQDGENGDLFTEDIDDDEIDSYILTDQEAQVKEKFWMKCNGEHLEEVARRKKLREEEEAKEGEDGKKKKKRNLKKRDNIEAATPAEAIEKIIQEKKLSNKVNYDILKEFSGGDERTRRESMGMEDDKKMVIKMEKMEKEGTVFKTPALPTPSASTTSTSKTPSTVSTIDTSTPSLPSVPSMKRKRAMSRPAFVPSNDMMKLSKALDLTPRIGELAKEEKSVKKPRLEETPKKTNGVVKETGEKKKEGEKRIEETAKETEGQKEKVMEMTKEEKKEEKTMSVVKKEEEKRVFTNRRAKSNHVPAIVAKQKETKAPVKTKDVEKEKIEKNGMEEKTMKEMEVAESSQSTVPPSASTSNEESTEKEDTATVSGEEKGGGEEGEKKEGGGGGGEEKKGSTRRSRVKVVIPQDLLWRSSRVKK